MTKSLLIRQDSVGPKDILNALKHNKREFESYNKTPDNIDHSRSTLNYCLAGDVSADDLHKYLKIQMINAGIDKPRINQVMAVEIMISLPVNCHAVDITAFFKESMEWIQYTYEGELLSFDVHLDESAPHAHALILPLIDGKMQGDRVKGGIGAMFKRKEDFHQKIGRRYGLSNSSAKKISKHEKQFLAKRVFEFIGHDPIKKSILWQTIRDDIADDPMRYIDILGMSTSPQKPRKQKSFVAIMTSPGKGSSKEPYIGFVDEFNQTLSCV